MARRKHLGSSFDSFLEEEGLLEDASAAALKRVVAWQIERLMKDQAITKSALADRMRTSRAQINRLLDHENPALTLESGMSRPIWMPYLCPRTDCLRIEAVTSACCRKLRGEPPPKRTTDVLTERETICEASTMS